VWLVAGVGRRLPEQILDTMAATLDRALDDLDPWDLDVEILPSSLLTDVVGPLGRQPMGPVAITAECPVAHELFSR
jgi:hypothetical protein